jgi:lipoprotein-releasing system permease protein
MPETLVFIAYNNCACLRSIKAKLLSYSLTPASKIPVTVKRLNLGCIPRILEKITEEVLNGLNSDQYYGVDWMQQKANFIKALNLEKQMIGIVLFLIIAVAAFNVVSMMVMVVADKKADIAILRTIGMTPNRIVKLFFYQGITIGITGIVIGTILGVTLALNIESVISAVEAILGFKFFPQDVFYILG